MKLWQKVYLITITLFVVLLNIGMYVVFELTYQKDIAVEKKQAQAQYNILTNGLIRSLDSLYQQGDVTDAKLQRVVSSFEGYYDDEICLTLWRDEKCLYPKNADVLRDWSTDAGNNQLILDGKDIKSVTVQGILYEGEDILYLRYEKELTELTDIWDKLQIKYIVISLLFSFVLAIILFVVLRKTMKPIDELTLIVDNMADGNMESRALEQGNDEIATLGKHFNQMADKIQENIEIIKRESAAKQEFVDNFAHELKSPLTSIYGFAEYIQKAKVSEEEKMQCMEYIMAESKNLLQLSYTMLDMAKIRNEEFCVEELSLCEVKEQISSRMAAICMERGVVISCDISIQKIYANKVLFISLISNLVQNAIYACESGGQVSWGIDEMNDKIRIYFKDNGCGMTEEQLNRVQEPFYRVDKARSREEGRTGLGLSICAEIVKYHNGEMEIQSEKGKGTLIFVTFPKKFTV